MAYGKISHFFFVNKINFLKINLFSNNDTPRFSYIFFIIFQLKKKKLIILFIIIIINYVKCFCILYYALSLLFR